jgi:hypothetical protein
VLQKTIKWVSASSTGGGPSHRVPFQVPGSLLDSKAPWVGGSWVEQWVSASSTGGGPSQRVPFQVPGSLLDSRAPWVGGSWVEQWVGPGWNSGWVLGGTVGGSWVEQWVSVLRGYLVDDKGELDKL